MQSPTIWKPEIKGLSISLVRIWYIQYGHWAPKEKLFKVSWQTIVLSKPCFFFWRAKIGHCVILTSKSQDAEILDHELSKDVHCTLW